MGPDAGERLDLGAHPPASPTFAAPSPGALPVPLDAGATIEALRVPTDIGGASTWRDTAAGYLYVLPALVVLLGFHFLPIFYALYISLFNWRIRQGPFVL